MIVVSDTSPITNLAAIGQLDLLRQLYQQVFISESVYRELIAEDLRYPGAVVEGLTWIEVRTVANDSLVSTLKLEVDEGEAEAIALAQEVAADVLLIDERLGRAVATRYGLKVVGLLGVLLESKRQSLIHEIKPLIDMLMTTGFRMSQDLYARVLSAAGE